MTLRACPVDIEPQATRALLRLTGRHECIQFREPVCNLTRRRPDGLLVVAEELGERDEIHRRQQDPIRPLPRLVRTTDVHIENQPGHTAGAHIGATDLV